MNLIFYIVTRELEKSNNNNNHNYMYFSYIVYNYNNKLNILQSESVIFFYSYSIYNI